MATPDLSNLTLSSFRSEAKPYPDTRFPVSHYRNIPYAKIPSRFSRPKPVTTPPSPSQDFTTFGPRCPQQKFDTRDYLRIPKSIPADHTHAEDEFLCANLNVHTPSDASLKDLPVLVWVYGGSMTLSWGSASQRIGDAGPIVAQAIELGKPIILVTVHFRLNIFSFGDGTGDVNLALYDQQAALKWVNKFIHLFGGDPKRVTLCGESAGAIQSHALCASGLAKGLINRVILQSGSLYTSPPQGERRSFGLVGLMDGDLQLREFDKGNDTGNYTDEASVRGAKPATLIECMNDLEINRFWLWEEPELKRSKWEGKEGDLRTFKDLDAVLLGDTADEWILWKGGFQNTTAKRIVACFETKNTGLEKGQALAKAYGIDGAEVDKAGVIQAAMHFLQDARFSSGPQIVARRLRESGVKAYQYHFDEQNPFKPEEAMAQHAVDLFALFGGYDEAKEMGDEMRRVGRMFRTKWIDFVNGEEPWRVEEVYLFGPHGETGAIDINSGAVVKELNPRRRHAQFKVIEDVGLAAIDEVVQSLFAIK